MTTGPAGPDADVQAVKFSRLARRGVLLGLSLAQVGVVGAGALLLVVSLYLGGRTLLYCAPALATLAALAWVRIAGTPVISWVPVAGRFVQRVATGQNVFHHRLSSPRPYGTLALPGDAASLRLWTDADAGGAMIHDPHARTLTAIVTVTHPAFTLLDPAEQQRRVTAWGRVLATGCRSGRVAALQVCERTLPDSGKGLTEWWAAHGSRSNSWVTRTYAELIDRAGPAGERHASTVSVSIDLRVCARAIRAAGGRMRGAAAVLTQEMESLCAALRAADLAPSAVLTPGDLALILRSAYDPVVAAALDRRGGAGLDLATAGPVSAAEEWGHTRSDSAFHCVLWISEWPRSAVYPSFLAPLIQTSGVRRTITVLFTPLRADAAARDIRKKKTEYLADAAQRAKLGQIEGAAQHAEYADVLQQEADLTAGHGVLRATGLICVSAPDLIELEQAVAAIEQAAIQASCETRRLWGQQAKAFAAAALPLCRPT
ncbi:SCO6880 family protein [Pengzhenrongella sicca]|uniref:PrgI family protein n=1 Tax=Pengzhenrongella sicca TaxID=2819238 RepID=A0A8A4Z9M4_9MICO|nr:SCO6880 family protein [Pengzhenrongella sicca]QTE28620.1 PrgI family protein [Pengzhenrongella sicca]